MENKKCFELESKTKGVMDGASDSDGNHVVVLSKEGVPVVNLSVRH